MLQKQRLIIGSVILATVAVSMVTMLLLHTEASDVPAEIPQEITTPEPTPTPVPIVEETPTPEPTPQKVEPPAGELLTPSGLTAAELEQGLLGDLKPYAADFIQAEQDTGVNAIFLASVAALESGWNSSPVAESRHNLFGWTNSTGYCAFDSKEDCIAFVAERIKTLYLSPDGAYFNGYTVEDVNVHYNGSPHWEETVRQIMFEIQNRIGGIEDGTDTLHE